MSSLSPNHLVDWFQDGQCGDFKFAAADGFDGTLQGFFTIPADLCVFHLSHFYL